MNENITFLKNSLIYTMSLSSKELFHSNVLAWLMKNDKNFINVFFDDFEIKDESKIRVEREWHNRDIVILDDNDMKYYVIENKFKSIPTIEQLKKYSTNKKIEKHVLSNCVLLGICDTLGDTLKDVNGYKWKYIDYNSITEKIYEIAKNSKNENIKNYLSNIEEYCNVLKRLNEVIKEELSVNENYLIYKNSLEELRIDDVFKKLKANQFINLIKDSYKVNNKKECYLDVDVPDGYHWSIFQDFHHKNASIEIRFSNWKDEKSYEKDYTVIGIEIEGINYRLFVEKNYKNNIEDIFNAYAKEDIAWFDKDYEKGKGVFGKKSSMKYKHNQYQKKGKYVFVYQHYTLKKEDLFFNNLYKIIQKDIIKAKDILEKNL